MYIVSLSQVMTVLKSLESGLLIYTTFATIHWPIYNCGPKGATLSYRPIDYAIRTAQCSARCTVVAILSMLARCSTER
jgi:hypothetical protein